MGGFKGDAPRSFGRRYIDVFGDPHPLPVGTKPVWRISGYVIVPGYGGTLLMVVPPWRKMFDLPGGGIHPEEHLTDGIIRECYEETGYRVRLASEDPSFFSEQNFYNHWHKEYCHALLYFFMGALVSDVQDTTILNRQEIRETESVEWVPLRDLNRMNVASCFLPIIEKLRSAAWPVPHLF